MKSRAIIFPFVSKYNHIFGEAPTGAEIITGLLSTVYKLDADKIAEILTDGATPTEILAKVVELDKVRVRDLTTKLGTTKFQEGYKKAKAEERTAVETEIKAHYGVESDKTGTELFDELLAAKAGEAGLTSEDAIKKSPTYQALESRLKTEVKKITDEKTKEITELKSGYAKENAFSVVGKNAIDLLTSLNPVLPKNAAVAETYKNNFLSALKNGYEYEQQADGKILVSKDGKLLEDAHGNTLAWDEHVKSIAGTHFEFAQNNGGANSGAGGAGAAAPGAAAGGPAYPAGITKPKTEAELQKIMTTKTIPLADRRIVVDTFRKENTAAQ